MLGRHAHSQKYVRNFPEGPRQFPQLPGGSSDARSIEGPEIRLLETPEPAWLGQDGHLGQRDWRRRVNGGDRHEKPAGRGIDRQRASRNTRLDLASRDIAVRRIFPNDRNRAVNTIGAEDKLAFGIEGYGKVRSRPDRQTGHHLAGIGVDHRQDFIDATDEQARDWLSIASPCGVFTFWQGQWASAVFWPRSMRTISLLSSPLT